jgi:hypothetical protein
VDYLEYDLKPDKWIKKLLRQIADGTYEPMKPITFYLAKSNGFSRRMTFPQIPDLVLYRTCVDYLYNRTRRFEAKHVYFERGKLAKVQGIAESKAKQIEKAVSQSKSLFFKSYAEYLTGGSRRFRAWLKYDQYRKYLIFKRIHLYIVITDITNFFDSVLFTHISDALFTARAPPRMVGLIYLLLERFCYRGGMRENPRIGLPVDEFDCSRKLAHMLLYSHDNRMVELVGEDNYVRWMDDQNFGVSSKAQALKLLSHVGMSLTKISSDLLRGKMSILGKELCANVVPLLILRYGDRRSLGLLKRIIVGDSNLSDLPTVVRSAALVYSSYSKKEFYEVRRAASRLRDNNLAYIVQAIEKIIELKDVPKRLQERLVLRYDAVAGYKFLDMRTLLSARLLKLNQHKSIETWLTKREAEWINQGISLYDQRMIKRLL